MMKRILPYLLTMAICLPACFASIADDPETADGYLTDNEYVNIAELDFTEELFVMGG